MKWKIETWANVWGWHWLILEGSRKDRVTVEKDKTYGTEAKAKRAAQRWAKRHGIELENE